MIWVCLRTTLGDYERNHTEPNITLIKIAKYFSMTVDDLLKQQLSKCKKSIDLKVLAITVDPLNRQNIELVSVKA